MHDRKRRRKTLRTKCAALQTQVVEILGGEIVMKKKSIKAWAVFKTIIPKDGRKPFRELDVVRLQPDSRYLSQPCVVTYEDKKI